jgi:hypothetical protein
MKTVEALGFYHTEHVLRSWEIKWSVNEFFFPFVFAEQYSCTQALSAVHTLEVIDQEVASTQDIPDQINRLDGDKSPKPDGSHPRV